MHQFFLDVIYTQVTHTFESFSFGHTDYVDHFVFVEDVLDGNSLLHVLFGPVHLGGDGASVDLDLHNVGLLLPHTIHQLDLRRQI